MNIYVPIPNYNFYSFFVHGAYIIPLTVASAICIIALYYQVKHKNHKKRNKRISVWKTKYLRKKYEIDKQALLQKTGKDFVYTLIKFIQKWLMNSSSNIDEILLVLTKDTQLKNAIHYGYYTEKEIAKNDENMIKEIVQKIPPIISKEPNHE